jgi:hypothetical protein
MKPGDHGCKSEDRRGTETEGWDREKLQDAGERIRRIEEVSLESRFDIM